MNRDIARKFKCVTAMRNCAQYISTYPRKGQSLSCLCPRDEFKVLRLCKRLSTVAEAFEDLIAVGHQWRAVVYRPAASAPGRGNKRPGVEQLRVRR